MREVAAQAQVNAKKAFQLSAIAFMVSAILAALSIGFAIWQMIVPAEVMIVEDVHEAEAARFRT